MITFFQDTKWISVDEIDVLKHNLNYSNWTDSNACSGKWKLEISSSVDNKLVVTAFMPNSRWGEKHNGAYWNLNLGELTIFEDMTVILLNDQSVRKIILDKSNESITVEIYERLIQFRKV